MREKGLEGRYGFYTQIYLGVSPALRLTAFGAMLYASSLYSPLREERKTGCLSGKGMNESFKYEEKNIVKDEDLTPDFLNQPGLRHFDGTWLGGEGGAGSIHPIHPCSESVIVR